MKVYIVLFDWHYETHLDSVFSSKELAEKYIENQEPPLDGSYIRYHIEERTLDAN